MIKSGYGPLMIYLRTISLQRPQTADPSQGGFQCSMLWGDAVARRAERT